VNEQEVAILKKVLKEMKDAQAIIGFWLKGSPIDATISSWIKQLESLLPKKGSKMMTKMVSEA